MNAVAAVERWVQRFNAGDVDGLAAPYAPDAVDHQVVMEPLHGREALRRMFATELGRAGMVCLIGNRFDCGEWAVLEWRDPGWMTGNGRCTFPHRTAQAMLAHVLRESIARAIDPGRDRPRQAVS